VIPPQFRETWLCDFEFNGQAGDPPDPLCLVAREYHTGRELRLWRHELRCRKRAPFDTGPDSLFVSYFACAELGCFCSLGWPLPNNVLDLFVEHRVETNGLDLLTDNSLLRALAHRGLAGLDGARKETMRDRIMNWTGGTASEQQDIFNYCADDTAALGRLLDRMAPEIDWPRALLRGRVMMSVAIMERHGVPIDTRTWNTLTEAWEPLKTRLITEVDRDYGIYDGTTFKTDRFKAWLSLNGIPWPYYPSGVPQLDGDTFRDMSLSYPQVAPLHQLRQSTAQLRLTGLTIGRDGRNRCLLSPFRASSSRNQPSNSKFIFGPATWIRSLIKPSEGHAVGYIDWSGQEYGITAALSGCEAMLDSYRSGDPHFHFAKRAGLVPADAAPSDYPAIREACKRCNLGTNYGLTATGLALRLGIALVDARELLARHHEIYWRFWQWLDQIVSSAMLNNRIVSTFGWPLQITAGTKPRTVQNFAAQSNGAEAMRIAAIAATEAGIEVCCPVHDAFLIHAPLDRIDNDVALLRDIMRRASLAVTGGLEIRTDAKIVKFPDRFSDERGAAMWHRILKLCTEIDRAAA